MKRTEIQTGVVYAAYSSQYDRNAPTAVIVVRNERWRYLWDRIPRGGCEYTFRPDPDGGSYSDSRGLLGVRLSYARDEDLADLRAHAQELEAMLDAGTKLTGDTGGSWSRGRPGIIRPPEVRATWENHHAALKADKESNERTLRAQEVARQLQEDAWVRVAHAVGVEAVENYSRWSNGPRHASWTDTERLARRYAAHHLEQLMSRRFTGPDQASVVEELQDAIDKLKEEPHGDA